MRVFLMLILTLSCTMLRAQEIPNRPNQRNNQGQKDGAWIICYDSSWKVVKNCQEAHFYRLIRYEDDRPVGQVTDHYASGKVQMQADSLFKETPEAYQGTVTWFLEDGTKTVRREYKAGKLLREFYYDTDGTVIVESTDELLEKSEHAYVQFNYNKTITLLQKAIIRSRYEFGEMSENHALSLNNLAFVYYDLGKYQRAEALFLDAKKILDQTFDPTSMDYAGFLTNMGDLYSSMARFSEAERYYLNSKSILEVNHGKNNFDYSRTIQNLALLYDEQGKDSLAESLYLEAISIDQKILDEDDPEYATTLDNLGLYYKKKGDYQNAKRFLHRAKAIREKNPGKNSPDYTNSLNNLGILHQELGQFKTAEDYFLRAKKIDEKILGVNNPDYAITLNNLALLYAETHAFSSAEQYYLKALTIRKNALGTSHPGYALSLVNIGALYINLGNYDKAEAFLRDAREIYLKTQGKEHQEYARTLTHLAILYSARGEYKRVLPLYEEVVRIRGNILGKNHPDYARSLNNLAIANERVGEIQKAESLYLRAKQIRREQLGPEHQAYANTLNTLGDFYANTGRIHRAEPLFREAATIRKKVFGKKHPDYAQSLSYLAKMYDYSGKYTDALPLYQEASEVYLQQIQTNFSYLSEREKSLFFNTFKHRFYTYNSFVLRAHKQLPAITGWLYTNTINIKGVLFQQHQKIKQAILSGEDEVLKEKYRSWQQQKDFLGYAYTLTRKEQQQQDIQLDLLEKQANALEKELSLASTQFAKALNKTPVHWKHVQRKLKPGEAAIEIVRSRLYSEEKTDSVFYFALLITSETKKQPDFLLLPYGYMLENKFLRGYRNAINHRHSTKNYYQYYWKSIADHLDGIQKVYLSPDGVYHQLNLNTLENPATGKYLLEEIDIQLLGNTKDLVQQNNASPLEESVFVGHPLYDLNSQKHQTAAQKERTVKPKNDQEQFYTLSEEIAEIRFSELPGTEKEILDIHELFVKRKLKDRIYLNEQALEDVIKAVHRPRILHLATHGFFLENERVRPTIIAQQTASIQSFDLDFDLSTIETERQFSGQTHHTRAKRPMLRSGLVFTGVSSFARYKEQYDASLALDDGILTAFEAQSLRLEGTELVVLSACQTGQGDVLYGEGVYGLQRGFQVAGAKTLLMSLWNVDDAATQELMVSFYDHWLSGKSKRQAFRHAQQQLMQTYRHPYFWGAFVMIGQE